MCDKAFSKGPLELKYSFGLYKIPKMFEKAGDYEHDPNTIFYIRLFSWHYRYK